MRRKILTDLPKKSGSGDGKKKEKKKDRKKDKED